MTAPFKIERVGFFHFTSGYDDPIGSLESALPDHAATEDSLLVLPETFNLGRDFYNRQPRPYLTDVASRLVTLAASRKMAILAGLLEPLNDNGLPYNSAILTSPDIESTPVVPSRKDDAIPETHRRPATGHANASETNPSKSAA